MITELSHTAHFNGVDIAWDRLGNNPDATPFLLCHGFSGSSHDFALVAEELTTDRDVIVLDHRGHGASTKLTSVDGYSIDILANDLITFIDTIVGQPVHLLGHSMGGAISINTTLARPDLIKSLILMDTTGWSFRQKDPAMANLFQTFLNAYDPSAGLPTLNIGVNPEEALITAATTQAWQDLKLIRAASFDPYAMKALGLDLFAGDEDAKRARLSAITCAVTVIVGENDHPFIDQADELAARVMNGKVRVINGAYHSPQLTHSAEWLSAVGSHFQ